MTAWEWVEPNRPTEAHAVGRLARDFHEVTRGYAGPVPEWNPLARARERLASAAMTGRDEAVMHRQMEQLTAAVGTPAPARMPVVHGDLHDGNVIANDRGPVPPRLRAIQPRPARMGRRTESSRIPVLPQRPPR